MPCLFYVDFEDQVFCYYDVRVSAGPVTGFIDMINDDVKEALERISSIKWRDKSASTSRLEW